MAWADVTFTNNFYQVSQSPAPGMYGGARMRRMHASDNPMPDQSK
jgi:hypothetical protein